MTDKKQPEALAFCWATELAMTQQPVTLSVTEAREVSAEMQRLHAENTALRHGYAAARLEIESLKAQQPGTAYAALPTHSHAGRVYEEGFLIGTCPLYTADQMRAFADHTHALRASHVQAPAQAAPAYKDSTPELHIGDSAFESWYSTYSPAHKSDKQRSRDAYAAGMGDPLVTAAPAGESLRTDALCDLSYSHGLKAGWNYCASDDLAGFEKAQKIGTEALRTLKSTTAQAAPQQDAQEPAAVVVTCHTPSGKRVALYSAKQDLPIGTQLYTAPQPSPAAQGDALDAAKQCLEMGESFRALRRVVNLLLEARRNLGPEDHELRDRIDQLLRADAARAAQEGK